MGSLKGQATAPSLPGVLLPSVWVVWEGGSPQQSLYPQVSMTEVAEAASYMCVAENLAGSAEKLFTLRVQGEVRVKGWLGVSTHSLDTA